MPGVLVDAAIARLAGTQEGNVTTRQLLEAGLSGREIESRRLRGALIPRHRGVYAVGHVPDDWFSAAFAAWLAYGRTSALSHLTCAAALRVLAEPDPPFHVTRPTRGREHRGTALHTADLGGEVWHRRGLVLTSPARLMLDLAATKHASVVERAYNQAQILKLITPAQLAAAVPRWEGRRGVRLLKALLEDHGVSHSGLEDALLALVKQAGLPGYERNVWIDGVFVDAVWREQGVIVELDGRRFHGHDLAFEGDRTKGNHLALRGWTLLRFTYRRLTQEPLTVVAEISAALAQQQRPAA